MTPVLAVYSVHAKPDGLTPTLLATYELPQTDPEYTCHGIWCRSDPAPCAGSAARTPQSEDDRDPFPFPPSKPFFPDPLNQLVTFDYTFRNGMVRGRFMLFVLSRFLLGHSAGMGGQVVEWADWGPANTRLIQDEANPTSTLVCYTHGFKYAYLSDTMEPGQDNQWLHIMDFNPSALLQLLLSEPKSGSKSEFHLGPDDFESSIVTEARDSEYGPWSNHLFVGGEVVTALPYVETKRKVPLQDGAAVAVMIDLERVVFAKVSLQRFTQLFCG
jgi:hypothetical protein